MVYITRCLSWVSSPEFVIHHKIWVNVCLITDYFPVRFWNSLRFDLCGMQQLSLNIILIDNKRTPIHPHNWNCITAASFPLAVTKAVTLHIPTCKRFLQKSPSHPVSLNTSPFSLHLSPAPHQPTSAACLYFPTHSWPLPISLSISHSGSKHCFLPPISPGCQPCLPACFVTSKYVHAFSQLASYVLVNMHET